jgi:hypothetical protein
LPPASIDAATLDAVRDTCARHPRRPFVLPRTDVFGGSVYVNPDGQVSGGMAGVYLPPEPAEPLLELMQAIWQRWPECPPYQGVLERVVPHVTVAIVPNDPQQITTVVDFARPFLPIHARPKRSA